jgi:hypothetical protein
MKVKLLLLENLETEIKNEIQLFLDDQEEESEERRIRRIIGGDDEDEVEKPKQLFVNMSKYYKETDFYFKKEDVTGLFLSSMVRNDSNIMVIMLQGKEYDCLYDQEIFDELINYLNS